jgi:MFS family permease
MLSTGAAFSYPMLLVTRVFLGAVQATSGPTLASLTGDLFPAHERSRIFAFIHAGELIGAGIGFLVSGEIAAIISWRWSFWVLSVPGIALAVALRRGLDEPRRGGTSTSTSTSAPPAMTFSKALRYLLRIRTNVALIAALALGYFFLGGARTFGVVFVRGQYDLDQAAGTAVAAVLGAGALAGLLIAGRSADVLLHRGEPTPGS